MIMNRIISARPAMRILIAGVATLMGVGLAALYDQLTVSGSGNWALFFLLVYIAPGLYLLGALIRRSWRDALSALVLGVLATLLIGAYIGFSFNVPFD
jgi:hypothetical protein